MKNHFALLLVIALVVAFLCTYGNNTPQTEQTAKPTEAAPVEQAPEETAAVDEFYRDVIPKHQGKKIKRT